MGRKKVEISDATFETRIEILPNGCWRWTTYINPQLGYGYFRHHGKNHLAHRLAYEHYIGPIPEGVQLHHICENRACVNPAHLEVLSRRDHVRHHRAFPACGVCGSTRRKQNFYKGKPNGWRCMDCHARRARERSSDDTPTS